MIPFSFLPEVGPQPDCRQLLFSRWELVAKCREEAFLCLPPLCLPVEPYPVLCLSFAPSQFSGYYLSSSSRPGVWKSQHPHPNQQPNEPPKAWPARHSPAILMAQDPGRNWTGMCLLGQCLVLIEAGLRASPCPSLTDT